MCDGLGPVATCGRRDRSREVDLDSPMIDARRRVALQILHRECRDCDAEAVQCCPMWLTRREQEALTLAKIDMVMANADP